MGRDGDDGSLSLHVAVTPAAHRELRAPSHPSALGTDRGVHSCFSWLRNGWLLLGGSCVVHRRSCPRTGSTQNEVLAAPPHPKSPMLPGTRALTGSIVTLTPSPNPTPSNMVSANNGRRMAVGSAPPGRWSAGHQLGPSWGPRMRTQSTRPRLRSISAKRMVIAGRAAQAAATERGDGRCRRAARPIAS